MDPGTKEVRCFEFNKERPRELKGRRMWKFARVDERGRHDESMGGLKGVLVPGSITKIRGRDERTKATGGKRYRC
jgi:hypothetical protein